MPPRRSQIAKANIPTPREQTVIIGQVDYTVFDSWNGMIPNGIVARRRLESLAQEAMFYLNLATGELLPWLATGYKYNDSHTELTFTFDPKVKWSDGQPFTSNDFKFTVMLLKDRKDLLGGGGDLGEFVKTVETPDPHTAVIKMLKPTPRLHYGFIAAIAGPNYSIMPEHIWKGQDPTKFRANPPVATGPYVLQQAIRSQKMFVWKKSPDYWNKDKLDPAPEYVIYQSTAKQIDSASLAFERAEFDVGSIDQEHATQLTQHRLPEPGHHPVPRPEPPGVLAEQRSGPRRHRGAEDALGDQLPDRPGEDRQLDLAGQGAAGSVPVGGLPEQRQVEERRARRQVQVRVRSGQGDPAARRDRAEGRGRQAHLPGQGGQPRDHHAVAGRRPVSTRSANVLKTDLDKVGVPTTLRSLRRLRARREVPARRVDIDSSWAGLRSTLSRCTPTGPASKCQPIGDERGRQEQARFRNPTFDARPSSCPRSTRPAPRRSRCSTRHWRSTSRSCRSVGDPDRLPVVLQHHVLEGLADRRQSLRGPAELVAHFLFVVGKLKPTGQKAPK